MTAARFPAPARSLRPAARHAPEPHTLPIGPAAACIRDGPRRAQKAGHIAGMSRAGRTVWRRRQRGLRFEGRPLRRLTVWMWAAGGGRRRVMAVYGAGMRPAAIGARLTRPACTAFRPVLAKMPEKPDAPSHDEIFRPAPRRWPAGGVSDSPRLRRTAPNSAARALGARPADPVAAPPAFAAVGAPTCVKRRDACQGLPILPPAWDGDGPSRRLQEAVHR